MATKALIFDVQRNCSEDGPGIRTTVFFKGCPLACVWCQNPEGVAFTPGISFRAERCRPEECRAPCIPACPAGALARPAAAGPLSLDRQACTRCDLCFAVCRSRALEPVGRWISLEDLLQRVLIDRPIFQATGGGVTLSGGEPTAQMGFAERFLRQLRRHGVHTVIETCGDFDYDRFRERLLPHLDLIYFDLKLIDDDQSRRYTGRSNRRILDNFSRLAADAGSRLVPRIPLVPGITATPENLAGLARFLRRAGLGRCSLMPYNPLWVDKLPRLGARASYHRRSFMSPAAEAACVEAFASGE